MIREQAFEYFKSKDNREELVKLIRETTVESTEAAEILGLSKQRLTNLKGKLDTVKKGIYLRQDIEARKSEQDLLRQKFYRPKNKVE